MEIFEIESLLREVFDETELLDSSSTYEKTDDPNEHKLIIFLNKVYYTNTNILYTKLIFRVDKEHENITKDYFTYLWDINCIYKQVNFSSKQNLKSKLSKIFKDKLFGPDIKTLSEFLVSPSVKVNEYLNKNNIIDVSVYGFKYDPLVKIQPCKTLNFHFTINISNKWELDLKIDKSEKDLYYIYLTLLDDTKTIQKEDLNNLDELIGNFIKQKLNKETTEK